MKSTTINIRKKICFSLLALLATTMLSFAQDGQESKTVSGTVVDGSSGEPIVAARISTLQEDAMTISKENGIFSFEIYKDASVLIVEADGFLPRQYTVKDGEENNIKLFSDKFSDQAIEFSTFYGVLDKINGQAGNFVATQPLSGFENVDDQIALLNNGVLRGINRSGINSTGSVIFMNGLNSVNANTQPLYIVDGVYWEDLNDAGSLFQGFYTNPMAVIDPNMIERIDIIKNGTAIYGSKGSNGVIILETKKGVSQVTKINVSSVVGVSDMPSSIPVMNADEYKIYLTEMIGTVPTNLKYASEFDEMEYFIEDPNRPFYNKYHNETNWSDEIYRQAVSTNTSINVDGGDDRAMYHFALGYRSDQGVVQTTNLQRLNTIFNADISFGEYFTLGWNIGYTDINRELSNYGVDINASPVYMADIKSPFLSPYMFTATGLKTLEYDDSDFLNIGNPSAILQNGIADNSQYRFNIGMLPVYKLNNKVSISNKFDYSLYDVREKFYRPHIGSNLISMPDGGISSSTVANQSGKQVSLFEEFQITYNEKLKGGDAIDLLGGYRYYFNNYASVYAVGHNTATDNYRTLNSAADYRETESFDNKSKSVSLYGNGKYRVQDKYTLNASFSMDASSKFGVDTKGVTLLGTDWGLFYSVAGEWFVSSEDFLKSVSAISQLKLHAGYDVTGNDDIGYYNKYPYRKSTFYLGKATGLVIGNIANSSIQWETTKSLNGGIDLALFEGRVTISANAYLNNVDNVLAYKSLPKEAGIEYYLSNEGAMKNNGYDVSLNVRLINKNKIKWEVGGSIGHYKNEVTAWPDDVISLNSVYNGAYITKVGSAANSFYGYETDGIYKTQAEADADGLYLIDNAGNRLNFGAGDVKFVNTDDNKEINEDDMKILGDPNPDYFGNINTRLMIGNFEFTGVISYSLGGQIYNYYRQSLESGLNYNNQSTALINRWRNESQDIVTAPRAVYGDPMMNSRFSDRWVEDADYIKLSSLSIAYDIPIKNGKLNGVKFWASANNLITITDYLGQDPEFSLGGSTLMQGVDLGILPSTRNFSFGIKLNL